VFGARMRATVALLMFAVLVAPAAARTHVPKCVKRHGQRACRVPAKLAHKPPSAPLLRELVTAASKSPAKKHKQPIPAKTLKVALKRLSGIDGFAAELGTLSPAHASRAAHAADAGTQNVSADGWSGTATVDIPVHSDATGTDMTATVTMSNGSTDGTVKKVDQHLVADCPDAAGIVSGTAKHELTMQTETPVPGGRTVKVTVSFGSDATLTGHTATDGTLRDWDQRMKFLAHIQVALLQGHKVIETTPPLVWTTHLDATLTPANASELAPVGENLSGPGIFSSFGTRYVRNGWEGEAAQRVLSMATFSWLNIAHDTKDDLLTAKSRHWDTGDCVKLSLSAPKQELAASESVPVTSTLGGPSGKGVAPATLTTSATDGAVVTPGSTTADSAPLTLTTIAPSTFNPGDSFTVTANAVSKQGRGSASITFHAAQGAYELVYTHTTHGSTTYGYDHSSSPFTDTGTWTENRDVQVSATVPLTRAADGSFSGSGPIRWDKSTWSQEDNETSDEGQQYPSFCNLDDHETVSATTPGTLAVSALHVDTPGATVKLTSLGETWHQNDVQVSGPCPGRTDNYARNTLLGEIGRDHYGAGDAVSWGSGGSEADITLSRGWAAGTGDTVATRTLSGMEASGPDGRAAIPYTDRFAIVRTT
jgi:hypothetical protein